MLPVQNLLRLDTYWMCFVSGFYQSASRSYTSSLMYASVGRWSFLVPSSVLLYEFTCLFSHPPVGGHLVCF